MTAAGIGQLWGFPGSEKQGEGGGTFLYLEKVREGFLEEVTLSGLKSWSNFEKIETHTT